MRRLPQVPRVFPPVVTYVEPRSGNYGHQSVSEARQNDLEVRSSKSERGYLSSRPSLPLALDSLEERFLGPPKGVGFRSINQLLCFCLSGLGELTLHSPNPRPYNLASWCMTLNKNLLVVFKL